MMNGAGSDRKMVSKDRRFNSKDKNLAQGPVKPTITISRPAGVGGYTVASKLAEYLQARIPCPEGWTVWSKNLVEKVLEDHNLQGKVANFIREGHKGMMRDTLEEWLGLHPSAWTLVDQTNKTMLQLAEAGNVILMGWGSFLVTRELENVFHVRLVASFEKKMEKVLPGHNFDEKSAARYIKQEDQGRRRYIKDNFGEDVDNPLLYHMVINLDLIGHQEAARLIGNAVIGHFGLPVRATTAAQARAV